MVPFRPMDDVVAVLDHLAVDRFSVIGCSMGGTLAVDLAVQCPARVQAHPSPPNARADERAVGDSRDSAIR